MLRRTFHVDLGSTSFHWRGRWGVVGVVGAEAGEAHRTRLHCIRFGLLSQHGTNPADLSGEDSEVGKF